MMRAWLEASEREARARLSWEGRPFHTWLVDLVTCLDGPDGLARLATDTAYPHRVHACHAWLDRLEDAGRLGDAITSASAAVDTLDRSLDRAEVADRLARLQRLAGDRRAASAAGLRSVRDDATLLRLRHVLDDAEAAGHLVDVVPELVAATDADGDNAPLVRIAALVIAGRLADVAPVGLGDSRSLTRGFGPRRDAAVVAVAVGALLLGCRPAHDDLASRLSKHLVATIDQPSPGDLRRASLHEARRHRHEAEPEPADLGPRLCASIAASPCSAAHLGRANGVVAAAADSVLGAKERSRYATVARLVVALSHTTAAVDGTSAADLIAAYDTRFRRFSAFRAELRTATADAAVEP